MILFLRFISEIDPASQFMDQLWVKTLNVQGLRLSWLLTLEQDNDQA